MKRTTTNLLLLTTVILGYTACGGDGGTGPVTYGPPAIALVNGVTKPTGLVGMTVIIEGTEFGTHADGNVYFLGTSGAPVPATAEAADWTNTYIVTTVPLETATSSKVWVTTKAGVTDSIEFTLVSANTFSPSNINWTRTADLPQALQGLGAAFVPIVIGGSSAKYVFTVGGAADITNIATDVVFRGAVQETGAISAWNQSVTRLPAARAYHAVASATPYSARLDTTAAAGYLYAIGGVDATGATVNTVLYSRVLADGTLGAWQNATALPVGLHSTAATIYRGFLYVVGGANAQNQPTASAYRALVNADGSLGAWQAIASLPAPVAHHGLVNFGPYLYAIGGDAGAIDPALNAATGTESSAAYLAKIDMRTGAVTSWSGTTTMPKARSKHGTMAAGAVVVVTSGMYAGQAGSSENSYATIANDGTLSGWGGATGASTIQVVLGYSLYNQAAVSFTDATGRGHVLVLGGANRSSTGRASAAVVYY